NTGGASTGGMGGGSNTGGTGGGSTASTCEPMPPPTGATTLVTPAMTGQLQSLIFNASPHETFVFASGTYALEGAYLWVRAPGVTLRSESGNPEDVVLDGGYQSSEIVTIAASDVTIAELSIRRAFTHPIHVTGSDTGPTVNTRIYRVFITDPREQAIKINPSSNPVHFADDGEIACSRIVMTDAGRGHVSDCYTGGVDAHQARGWLLRDNEIEGFWCESGLAEHAIHFWRGCRDTMVERNVLVDNARGVGLGMATSGSARTYPDNPCPAAGGAYVDHYGGIVRNNFIVGKRPELFSSQDGFDTGIGLWSACNAVAVHNTIVATNSLFSAIEWRFSTSTGIRILNNLATHALRERDGASAESQGNIDNAALSQFEDVAAANLHLKAGSSAIDHGVSVGPGLCAEDIDGDLRDATPDVGADERLP
ncbi:MAG TPA: hypothetical protein PL065_05755, partial [Polyangiaceae bacterium]|nr:hypothetical protein [Polyangiaceae bacterium]